MCHWHGWHLRGTKWPLWLHLRDYYVPSYHMCSVILFHYISSIFYSFLSYSPLVLFSLLFTAILFCPILIISFFYSSQVWPAAPQKKCHTVSKTWSHCQTKFRTTLNKNGTRRVLSYYKRNTRAVCRTSTYYSWPEQLLFSTPASYWCLYSLPGQMMLHQSRRNSLEFLMVTKYHVYLICYMVSCLRRWPTRYVIHR